MSRSRCALGHAAVVAGLVGLLGATAFSGTAGAEVIAATDEPVLLDFEDVPADAETPLITVSKFYEGRGVVFDDTVSAARIPPDNVAASLPSSGAVLLLRSCFARASRDLPCGSAIAMSFTRRMVAVAVSVGTATPLEVASEVELAVLDVDGNVVDSDRATLPATGAAVSAKVARLEVLDAPDVHGAVVSWVDDERGPLLVDDVYFAPYVPTPALHAEPESFRMELDEGNGIQVVDVTNHGDAATAGVTAAFRSAAGDASDPDAAAIHITGDECLDGLPPRDTCSLTIEAKRVATGLMEGAIVILDAPSALASASARQAVLLRIPLEVEVFDSEPVPPAVTTRPPTTAPLSTAPSTTSPTTTTSAPSPTDTPSVGPTSGTRSPDRPDLDLATLVEDQPSLLPLLVALGLGAVVLARGHRVRGSRPSRLNDRLRSAAPSPHVRVRPDHGSVRLRETGSRRVGLTVRTPAPFVTLEEEGP